MKKLLKFILWLVLGLLAIALVSIIPVDETDFNETDFYAYSLSTLDSVLNQQPNLASDLSTPADSFKAGWGMATITPPEPVRLTGKNWSPFEHVFDSVYVRCFIFQGNGTTVAMINYDLWIMHPHLAERITNAVSARYPQINGILFTANHSHTSIGGWASGLLGSLVIGGNSTQTVEFIEQQTLKALQEALHTKSTAYIGYQETATEGLVENRLDSTGALDTYLRFLEIQNQSSRASLTTYAAHSVYMNKDINTLSADYPGDFLSKQLLIEDLDFAAFAPGATGSHTPIGRKPFTRAKMDGYAQRLHEYYLAARDSMMLDSLPGLRFIHWPVQVRSPHFRISNHWRLRPGIFETIMGNPEPYISAVRIGNNVLVGLPIELSGEYYSEFSEVCERRGLNLLITSFNGTYLGYANPERYYYTLKRSETREMNWCGPQSGEYFVDLIINLLEKI